MNRSSCLTSQISNRFVFLVNVLVFLLTGEMKMDKKMHIERMWTDRVQRRIAGIGIGTKKYLQRFWERLKNLFK